MRSCRFCYNTSMRYRRNADLDLREMERMFQSGDIEIGIRLLQKEISLGRPIFLNKYASLARDDFERLIHQIPIGERLERLQLEGRFSLPYEELNLQVDDWWKSIIHLECLIAFNQETPPAEFETDHPDYPHYWMKARCPVRATTPGYPGPRYPGNLEIEEIFPKKSFKIVP